MPAGRRAPLASRGPYARAYRAYRLMRPWSLCIPRAELSSLHAAQLSTGIKHRSKVQGDEKRGSTVSVPFSRHFLLLRPLCLPFQRRRNRSGRPGGCRTNNLDKQEFLCSHYIDFSAREMNKKQAEQRIHYGQLILRKISKSDATRCQILRQKCTKYDFRWGSAPDPAGRAHRAFPKIHWLYLRQPTSKGRG